MDMENCVVVSHTGVSVLREIDSDLAANASGGAHY